MRYPLRDFGPFAGGGSGYGALMGISTPVRHSFLKVSGVGGAVKDVGGEEGAGV